MAQDNPTASDPIPDEAGEATARPLQIRNIVPCIQVRTVFKTSDNQFRCRTLAIDPLNQGQSLILQLQKLRAANSTTFHRILESCVDFFYMRQSATYLATVSLCSSSMILEAQPLHPKVYIKHTTLIDYLTDALHKPDSLEAAPNLVVEHLLSVIDGPSNHIFFTSPRQALYVGKAFSRAAALAWLGIALILVVALGVAVGLIARDAGLGFAAGGGLLAVFASMQCVMLWQGNMS